MLTQCDELGMKVNPKKVEGPDTILKISWNIDRHHQNGVKNVRHEAECR